MEPPKFTPSELGQLVAQAVSWMQEQRESFLPSSHPLSEEQNRNLQSFFSAEILGRLRVVDAHATGQKIPYPPFYEKVRAGGARVVPDAAHMTAMPFIDVAVFNRQPTLRTLFHTLVHVAQFEVVGVERVMKGYFETLNESGLWMVVPYEEQAYQLDARYTRDPHDTFSVEKEVSEWAANGRFNYAPRWSEDPRRPHSAGQHVYRPAADSRRTVTPAGPT